MVWRLSNLFIIHGIIFIFTYHEFTVISFFISLAWHVDEDIQILWVGLGPINIEQLQKNLVKGEYLADIRLPIPLLC